MTRFLICKSNGLQKQKYAKNDKNYIFGDNEQSKPDFNCNSSLRPYSHETFLHTILRYCDKNIFNFSQ